MDEMDEMDDETMAGMFGRYVRKARRALDLTQEELAEHLGVTQSQISQIERGVHDALRLLLIYRLSVCLALDLNDCFRPREETTTDATRL